MTCPQCGHEIPDGLEACPSCGYPVVAQIAGPSAASRRRRHRARIALATLLAVVLVGGGVAGAGVYFGWFGSGGTHPYDVLPAATAAYVQLDLNPSMAQKAQAWQFLHDLPGVKDAAGGQPDPKRLLWNAKDFLWLGSTWTDYERDVQPWLGDRIGVGVLDVDSQFVTVTALQVTDQAAASAKLNEWIRDAASGYRVTFTDGYALVTATATAAVVDAELAKGRLGADPRFAADLRAVGDTGFAAGWVDLERATGSAQDYRGHSAFALRFSADTMEFAGTMSESNLSPVSGAGELGNLPAATGAAACVSGGETAVGSFLPSLGGRTGYWSQFGVDDADAAALFGRNLCLATSEPAVLFGGYQTVGLRVVSDDAARAQSALRKMPAEIVQDANLSADRVDGSVFTAATSDGYLHDLTGGGATLASTPVLARVVPDHVAAGATFYVNLTLALADRTDAGSAYAPFLSSLEAMGGQYRDAGSGNGTWSVRIVRS